MVDPLADARLEGYIARLVEVRRKKNVTPDMARDMLTDANYFGTVRPRRACSGSPPLRPASALVRGPPTPARMQLVF